MTELEAKAKDCIENHTHKLVDKPTKQDIYLREEAIFISGYKLGATENSIQWHDIRKDPKDLPKPSELFYDVSERVIGVQEVAPRQFMSIECRYDLIEKKWRISQDPYYADVIAWCEIPQFNLEGVK